RAVELEAQRGGLALAILQHQGAAVLVAREREAKRGGSARYEAYFGLLVRCYGRIVALQLDARIDLQLREATTAPLLLVRVLHQARARVVELHLDVHEGCLL